MRQLGQKESKHSAAHEHRCTRCSNPYLWAPWNTCKRQALRRGFMLSVSNPLFSVRALESQPLLCSNRLPLEYYWIISRLNLPWFTISPSDCLALPPSLVPVTAAVTLCLPLPRLFSALSVIPCSLGIFTRGRRDCAGLLSPAVAFFDSPFSLMPPGVRLHSSAVYATL